MLLILNTILQTLAQVAKKTSLKNICSILIFASSIAIIQAQDGRDCVNAKLLCGMFYHETYPNHGLGHITDEVGDNMTCMYAEEEAITWYAFTAQRSGKLGFHIIPQDPNTDLDWALFDLTNASCEDLQSNANALVVSCNATGGAGCHGTTGMTQDGRYDIQGSGCNSANPSQSGGYWPFNALVDVTKGSYYVLAIQNWTYLDSRETDTYVIDFWLTDESILNAEPVRVETVETSPSFCELYPIKLNLNVPISCDLLENLDIRLENSLLVDLPTTPILIDCTQGSEFTTEVLVRANFRGAMPGRYFLSIDDTEQNRNALNSRCGSTPDLPYRTAIDFLDNSLIISILNLTPTNDICAGQSIYLRAQELLDISLDDQYIWTLPNGRTQEGREIEASLAGEYRVDVLRNGETSNPHCERGTAFFYIEGDFELDLGPDIYACSGEFVQLNAAAGGSTYQWNNGVQTRSVTVGESGLYILQVETNCGVYRDSIEVFLEEPIAFDVPGAIEVCNGESTKIGQALELVR